MDLGALSAHGLATDEQGYWESGEHCAQWDAAVRADRMQDRAIILPLFHEMTDQDQQRVAEELRAALA